MHIIEFGLYCLIILFCVYPIVDRICKCIETKKLSTLNIFKAFFEGINSLNKKED